jgi:hypothetical protein
VEPEIIESVNEAEVPDPLAPTPEGDTAPSDGTEKS